MEILAPEAMRAVTRISHHPPPAFKKHLIPGAFVTYIEGPFGKILSQEIKANGYTIWYHRFFITLPVLLYLVSDALLTALHYQFREGKYRLYGLPPGILKEAWFEPGEYRSVHIGLPIEKLEQLSGQYPQVGGLLHDLAEGTKEIVLPPLFPIHKKAELIIRDILACREEGEKRNLYLQERVVHLFNLYLEDMDAFERTQQRISRKITELYELKAYILALQRQAAKARSAESSFGSPARSRASGSSPVGSTSVAHTAEAQILHIISNAVTLDTTSRGT